MFLLQAGLEFAPNDVTGISRARIVIRVCPSVGVSFC